MYQVIFSKKAIKSLRRIPKEYQIKIKVQSEKLSQDPFSVDLKKLESPYQATHRSRVGPYRLFLQIDTTHKEVIIADIIRRTTQTYY
jgi:mRNA-degrading endonuclease RelE of RelBE toxin-antitoxin system